MNGRDGGLGSDPTASEMYGIAQQYLDAGNQEAAELAYEDAQFLEAHGDDR